MSPCTGNRVNTNYERIASWGGCHCWTGNHGEKSIFFTDMDDVTIVHIVCLSFQILNQTDWSVSCDERRNSSHSWRMRSALWLKRTAWRWLALHTAIWAVPCWNWERIRKPWMLILETSRSQRNSKEGESGGGGRGWWCWWWWGGVVVVGWGGGGGGGGGGWGGGRWDTRDVCRDRRRRRGGVTNRQRKIKRKRVSRNKAWNRTRETDIYTEHERKIQLDILQDIGGEWPWW